MANILPFNGYRYNAAMRADMGRLVAPPYDVIDPALRDTLWRLSEYNISRVTKADRNEQAPSGNPYEAAGALWERWLAQQIVQRDAQPAVYVYEQNFQVHGRKFSRTALVSRVQLEPPGKGVLPHENTLAGPKADRLLLMRATRTQFGQVFGLYPDPAGEVDALLEQAKKGWPIVHAPESEDLLHRLWAITDPAVIARIQALMAPKEILIADGHHRYETSLGYMAENPGNELARYRMMALVNMSNPGLVVLPIHRCVKGVKDFQAERLLKGLRKDFDVRAYPSDKPGARAAVTEEVRRDQAAGKHAFVLLLKDGAHWVVSLRNEKAMDAIKGRSEAWRRLDVTILHQLILEPLLGITPERLAAESNIEYVHDFPHAIDHAAEEVRAGHCQALFLLNPTRVEEVQSVAHNHERMPQKSTYFYPKMYGGLVFYRMAE
jgi:uncharacterized protein (DUF1015 family)